MQHEAANAKFTEDVPVALQIHPRPSLVVKQAKTARIAPYQWQPGQSGNPKGARKSDVARRIAKQIFENNEEEAYVALAKALLKGNAYVFKELAERAYGKLTEHHVLTDPDEILKRLVNGRNRLRSERAGV